MATQIIPTEENEPNDSRITAEFLPLTEDPSGSGYATGVGIGRQDPAPYASNFADPDYWRVELLAGDVVSVSVDTPGSTLIPYVELRDGSDQAVTSDQQG